MPPSATSKRPFLSACAPVKAPLRWPNSSLSSSVSGSAPQLTATKGRRAARPVVVDGARDQLLAGAGLAADQHRHRQRRRRSRPGGRRAASPALCADDLAEAGVARHLAAAARRPRRAAGRPTAARVAEPARVVDRHGDAVGQRADQLAVVGGEVAAELVAQRQHADRSPRGCAAARTAASASTCRCGRRRRRYQRGSRGHVGHVLAPAPCCMHPAGDAAIGRQAHRREAPLDVRRESATYGK